MKKDIFILLAISLVTSVYVLANSDTDSLYCKVQGFGIGLPQEKVYLHLDNTCYFLGDTIWYKGYVTRSDKGTLTDLSKILYVELLTPDGYSVERQQLEMTSGTASGMFILKDSLYAGYYELRAYTRWMQNFDPEFFFHRELTIYGNSEKDNIPQQTTKFKLRFFPEGGNLINGIRSSGCQYRKRGSNRRGHTECPWRQYP